MKPAPFTYHCPRELDEALDLLAEHGDEAAIIAGGQSLVPLMRFRLAQPAHLISIRRIPGLSDLRSSPDGVSVGASVTYSRVQQSAAAVETCPGVLMAIELIATPQVRSRGTLCGNMCQADPASELPAMALVMDALFRLQSKRGTRIVSATDYFQGPYHTAREADEILTHVQFPRRLARECVAIQEVTRLRGGFPMSGVAVAFTPEAGQGLSTVRIASFGANSVQTRCTDAEAILEQQGYTQAALDGAADALLRDIRPHSDPFASAEYRRSATRTLFFRTMQQAYARQATQR